MFGQQYAGWVDHGFGEHATEGRAINLRTHKIGDDKYYSRYQNRGGREARERAYRGKQELERLKKIYSNLNVVNPYQNLEKSLSLKNLQVSKKQAENERDVFQQNQSNILNAMRSATGTSGVSSLVQGLIRRQPTYKDLGEQESRNQMLAAQQSERINQLERKGRLIPTQFQAKKIALLMGMTQQEYNMNRQLELGYYNIRKKVESAAQAANQSALASLFGMMGGAAGEASGGGGQGTGPTSGTG